MQKLEFFRADFGEMEIIDEAYDCVQGTVNVCLIYPYLANTEQSFLPQIVFVALGDRHIELIADASFDFP